MSEPIILDGGPKMVKMKLVTSSFTQEAPEGKLSVFSVSPDPIDKPFLEVVITNHETKKVVNVPLGGGQWTIEIK
jgi:hypothetical protein